MRILLDLISKNSENEHTLNEQAKKTFALIAHITNYMTCLAYLREHDPNLKKKKILFKKFISSGENKQKNYYSRLLKYRLEENEIIGKALIQMGIDKAKMKNIEGGTLYRPFTWGVQTYDFQLGGE